MGHKVNHLHHLLPRLRMCWSVSPLGHVPSLYALRQMYLYRGITLFSALSSSLLNGRGQGYMALEGVFDPLLFGTSEGPSFWFLEHLHLKRPAHSRIIIFIQCLPYGSVRNSCPRPRASTLKCWKFHGPHRKRSRSKHVVWKIPTDNKQNMNGNVFMAMALY
jgi:hypothetical protein